MEESYIEIPEDEISVVDELTETVESLKEQLEEQEKTITEQNQLVLEYTRSEVVDELTSDMTEVQKIKLEKLSENVEAEDIEEFKYKVEQLKESYFDETYESKFDLSEEIYTPNEAVLAEENTSTVSVYADFLKHTVK